MRVELLTDLATRYRTYRSGDVVSLPDAEAIRLIDGKMALPVRTAQPEIAVMADGERAVSQHRKGKRS